ncbi:MAG TPA: hypothetical protein VF756_24210 [Thermoanaerobaculia bacterium]
MRKPVVLGFLALLASFVPAFAGTVYVPLATQQQIGDVLYRTEVVVSNPGNVSRRFTTAFIPTGRNGVQAGRTSQAISVLPNGTFLLTNVAPAGQEGILEISGAPQLAISARVEAVSRSGQILASTPVPVIGSENLIPKNEIVQIQGIERTARGTVQRFGLLNLGARDAQCSALAFQVSGAPVGNAARFTVQARSHAAFAAPLAALGSALFTDVRVEVTCNQPFYAYALQVAADGGALSFLAPSGSLESRLGAAADLRGDDDTPTGGDQGGDDNGGNGNGGGSDDTNPPAGSGPVAGQDSLSYPGLFLAAKRGDSYRAFDLPLRPGVRYKRITVDFDLYLNKWQTPLFHGITALRRNDRTLYYGLIVRGDRNKTVLDLGRDQLERVEGPWRQRSQYHIRMEADAQTRTVTFQMFQGGRVVHRLSGRMTTPDLSVTGQQKIRVDFGGTKVADGAYFPPYGWRYSNLTVRAEPF